MGQFCCSNDEQKASCKNSFAASKNEPPPPTGLNGPKITRPKGTFMQTWKFPFMFQFIWKYYPENFAFLALRIVKLFTRKVCVKRVWNNSVILTMHNTKFLGCYFHMNIIMYGDFKICISVPLIGLNRYQVYFSAKHRFMKINKVHQNYKFTFLYPRHLVAQHLLHHLEDPLHTRRNLLVWERKHILVVGKNHGLS